MAEDLTRGRLAEHILDFEKTLSVFEPTATVHWRIAVVANALFAKVRTAEPDHPVVSVINDLEQNRGTDIAGGISMGDLRALLRQMGVALNV